MGGPRRRRFLQLAGTAGAVGLAGCGFGGSTPTDESSPPARNDTEDEDSADREPTGLLDDFEAIHRWVDPDVSLVADTDRSLVGDQSGTFRVPADQTRGEIVRRFDPPLDLARAGLQLGLRATETCRPRLRAYDATGDWLEFRAILRGGLGLLAHDFSLAAVEGEPDPAAIEELRLSVRSGEEDGMQVWCDELRLTERPEPTMMLHFEGSFASIHSRVRPVLATLDIPAAAFVNPGYLGRSVRGEQRLSAQQIDDLAGDGWDICSQAWSYSHLYDRSPDGQEEHIRSARRWLRQHGHEGRAYFAYPYGVYEAATLELVAEHHTLGFARGWAAHGRVGNPLLIPRSFADPGAGDLSALIERASTYGGITTLVFEEVAQRDTGQFAQTMEYLRQRDRQGDLRLARPSDLNDGLIDPEA